MAVLTVGTNLQYSTLSAAIASSHDGDTIYVTAGIYTNDFPGTINTKINIVGVGGMAHFVATQTPPNGKAILVTANDVKIDHLEFSNVAVADNNGGGIRFEGGDLTVTNSYFHDNQTGILSGPFAGNVVVDHSEFARNDAGDGLSHNLYIGHITSFQITNSYIHDADVGHEIKSRADTTIVLNNRIADGNATASYSIDLPDGGAGTIQNNIIEQGPNSQNPAIIAFAEETTMPWVGSKLTVSGNTILNDRGGNNTGVWNTSTLTAQITGNHFYGLTPAQIASGANVQSGNDTLASEPAIDTSHPWANSSWDDIIWAGGATNLLVGTAGHDLFAGGTGNDTFDIKAGGNSDTIAAFDGAHDVVRLDGYSFSNFNGVKTAMAQQGADVVLNLGNGETLTFQNMQVNAFATDDFTVSAAPPTPGPKVTFDFNGDGRSDILWQNDSGQIAIWLMNGAAVANSGLIGSADPRWHAKGAGDFDGDGKSEILLQNNSGQAGIWQVNGTTLAGGGAVGANGGPSWHIRGIGDFNGDGKADVLWQNDDGQAGIWLMNGSTVLANPIIGSNPGSAWHIKGAGDFNGDGKSDVLWQNDDSQAGIWLMNGSSVLANPIVGSNPGPAWHIKGAADFNGDGKLDVLWQHESGQAGIWLMNGPTVVSNPLVGSDPGPSWHIQGAEDLNGDGKSDILLQHANGQASVWFLNGTSVAENDLLGNDPGATWHVDWA